MLFINKKFIALFLFLFISLYALAQDRINLGINFGPQISCLSGGDFISEFGSQPIISKPTIKWSAGLLFGYKIINEVQLQLGINYSNQGQKYHFKYRTASEGKDYAVLDIDLKYLKVPCLLYYELNYFDKISFSFMGGSELGFLIEANDNYQEIIINLIALPEPFEKYTKFDIALALGLGVNTNLGEKMKLCSVFKISYGLINVYPNPWGYLKELRNSKNIIIGMSIGLTYLVSDY